VVRSHEMLVKLGDEAPWEVHDREGFGAQNPRFKQRDPMAEGL